MKTAVTYALVAILMICLVSMIAKPIGDSICSAMDAVSVALGK